MELSLSSLSSSQKYHIIKINHELLYTLLLISILISLVIIVISGCIIVIVNVSLHYCVCIICIRMHRGKNTESIF